MSRLRLVCGSRWDSRLFAALRGFPGGLTGQRYPSLQIDTYFLGVPQGQLFLDYPPLRQGRLYDERNNNLMNRLYIHQEKLGLAALALLLALLIPSRVGFSQNSFASQRLVNLPSLRLQLALPVGWTVQTELGSRAARLIPPQPDWWPVELVAWSTPDPELTLEKAAAGHESLLAQRWDYRRQQARPFTTEAGQSALEVTGEIFTANDVRYGCIFAAYALEDKYYVLGTFYQPDQEAGVREVFEPLMRSLRRLPGSRVPEPPTPPPPSAPRPPSPLNLTRRYHNAVGLSVQLPEGWQTSLEAGIFHAYTSEANAGVFVWPVWNESDKAEATADFGQVARRLLTAWQGLAQVVFTEKAHRLQPLPRAAVYLARGDLTVTRRSVVAAVAIYMESQLVVLTAAYAPAEDFDKLMPDLAALLTTVAVQPRQRAGATGGAPELVTWSSQRGILTGQVPAGWQVRGGVRNYNGHTVIDLEGEFDGPPRLNIAWKQPYTPFFRQLTPLLRGLGRQEGEKYQDYGDEAPLRILSPRSPTDFLVSYLLPQTGISQEDITVYHRAPDLGVALLEPTSAHGALVQIVDSAAERRRLHTYIVATAELPVFEGSFRWEAAYLMAAGPASSAALALAALQTVVQTATVNSPDEEQDRVARLIHRARGVLKEAEPATGLLSASLLGPAFEPSATGKFVVPAQALECWHQPSLTGSDAPVTPNNTWWEQLGKHPKEQPLKNREQ